MAAISDRMSPGNTCPRIAQHPRGARDRESPEPSPTEIGEGSGRTERLR